MKRLLDLATLFLLALSQFVYAQSTEIRPGILLPQMTTAQRTALSATNGMLVFDTNTQSYWIFRNATWEQLSSTSTNYWEKNGLGGNEIKNTNTGGFWSANPTALGINTINPGTAPVNGAGTRLMWIPSLSAFRVGTIESNSWDADSIGMFSLASGLSTKARGRAAVAFGFRTSAENDNSVAIGNLTVARGDGSTAMGFSTQSTANSSLTAGRYTKATAFASTALGDSTTASGFASMAMGFITTARGYGSTAMGQFTTASGNTSTAMGYNTTASHSASTAMGQFTSASGQYSTAMGGYTTASNFASTAMGYHTFASSYVSTAMGSSTTASGAYSTAMGSSTTASGVNSTAMGSSTTASGVNSTAMGNYTTASGNYSTAMGDSTTASGSHSTAMGNKTTASGILGSTAMGYRTTASGVMATAMGYRTTASGANSTAMGTKVNTYNMQGTFMIGDSDPVNHGETVVGVTDQFVARFYNGYYLLTSGNGTPGVARTGVYMIHGDNSWRSLSDSTKKEKFMPVNGEEMLQKAAKLRAVTWNYKGQDPKTFRHYGPMAQEFFSAFGKDAYGTIGNDTSLASADVDGVLFVLVQALEKRTKELKQENEALKVQLNELQGVAARLERLEAMLNSEQKPETTASNK